MGKKVNVQETLKKIKIMVCIDLNYKVSDHVVKYIREGLCSEEDIEYCIEKADTIHGISEDEKGDSVDGLLYTILGRTRDRVDFYTTGKFKQTVDGSEFYFFVTAHEQKGEE